MTIDPIMRRQRLARVADRPDRRRPTPESGDPGRQGLRRDAQRRRFKSLQATQTEPPRRRRTLATGKATDPTAVVMAVERAQLAMQLASQIRTKAVEAAQDIFHTQV